MLILELKVGRSKNGEAIGVLSSARLRKIG